MIQKRHTFDIKETQKNIEADHQKFMDGVNRDFNQQAIELRIQIEEARTGAPLTDEEKQAIVNAQLKSKQERQGQIEYFFRM